jgi:hypothetical protein
MISTCLSQRNNSFAALRRFLTERASVEQCELCSIGLSEDHQHLIDPSNRKLICSCDPCSILFGSQGGKYMRVPRQIRFLNDFCLTEEQWESLMIPINMAFFFYSSPAGKVIASYPSPAGATESLLTLESWEEITQQNPILKEMETDVEALLVNRVGRVLEQAGAEYYLVPIDECYKLVGLIRAYWHGLSGGKEVWDAVGHFFAELKERSGWHKESTSP